MGSFTSTTPDTAGAKTAPAAPATSSHADQIQGASVSAAPPAPGPASMPVYSHADQIMGASIMPGDQPGFRIDPVDFPDPSNSPWLNPPTTNANVLDPFGGTGGTAVPGTPGAPVGRKLPAPPPLPPKPAPVPTPTPGFSGRVSGNDGQTPIYRPNEIEGGGNTKESAAYVEKKNADAAKIAKTEARVEAHHAEERAKVARERQRTAEKAQRWHAEETADARKAQVAQQQKLAKALTTKVEQLMEPAGHPGLSDDAKVVQAARRAPLTAEAAASNDRQAKALGKIGGVGDLPVYTADAAENYGDTGINEVADLIHRTAATDPAKAKALLDRTTARMSDAKAAQLKQTVARYKLDDAPAAKTRPSTSDRSEIAQRMEAARDMMDKLEDRMGPGPFKSPKAFKEVTQELRDLLPRDGRERQLLEEAMYEASLGNADAGRKKLSELRRNLADPALPGMLEKLEAAHGDDTRAARREHYQRRGDALDDLADLADEATKADRMLRQNRDAEDTWKHDPRIEDSPHLSERRDATRAEIDRDIARLEGQVEAKLNAMGEKFLDLKLDPGALHPNIDTDEAAWQKRIEEMDQPVIEALDIASDLSLGIAGKATKTLSKRLVKWAARAGMAKDAVQGFQKGVDDASRDVLRNAGVDPAKPEAVRAWLDKDPLNRKALMQAGVAAMAQNLAIGKAAGKLTGGIDGPQGAAAEMALKRALTPPQRPRQQ